MRVTDCQRCLCVTPEPRVHADTENGLEVAISVLDGGLSRAQTLMECAVCDREIVPASAFTVLAMLAILDLRKQPELREKADALLAVIREQFRAQKAVAIA